ncbi:D123 protein [Guillardia theta CCMP2712]|uniref:D123 protein n=1 Tax=Guillardia theta (strain CCMP2712) TaxID=905079 RepID=L1K3U9_GUITC|nr:D123 protein [Guillardia theta CCMP2712]EKX55043.1 D123 protein [Guillardia theta CCMP2712]|eukprot:XP_005842023.1 D123 protein [Guillardia theta CCMP2712]
MHARLRPGTILLICTALVEANQLSWTKDIERVLPAMTSTVDIKKADPLAPKIFRKDVCACQIQEWWPSFRPCTIKTAFIDLKEDFFEYLLQDGLVLPEGVEPVTASSGRVKSKDDYSDSDFSSSSESEQGSNPDEEQSDPNNPDDQEQATRPKFGELIDVISKAIEDLGGEVFPKLNWSAPKDATWINVGENLKCISVADVIILLKSSDFAVHDLCHAFDACADGPNESETTVSVENQRRPTKVVLALRKWFDMKTSMEFRCFVKDEFLVGISQRDCSSHYDFLLEWRSQIVSVMREFYLNTIRGRFPLKTFVFDAYIRQRDWKVFLIDFNPYGGFTQPLLFSWKELDELHESMRADDARPQGANSADQEPEDAIFFALGMQNYDW